LRRSAWVPLAKGKTGDRYILGNQNLTLKELLDQLAALTGQPAPQNAIPAWIPLTVAWIDEQILAPLGKTPSVPLDGVRMAQQPMYYNAAKAIHELGLPQTPLSTALRDSIEWFVKNSYVKKD
jgi:dihydroflavonol-4-reductase